MTTDKADSNGSSDDDSHQRNNDLLLPLPAVSLDTQLFYQNPTTGQASLHPLTIRQFIRIWQQQQQQQRKNKARPLLLTADTLVLRVAPPENGTTTTTTFVGDWTPARQVPVLRQVLLAVLQNGWYYEQGDSNSETTTQQRVQGPMSCRRLAQLFRKGDFTMQTRVYSEESSNKEWRAIGDFPELQVALDAFDDDDDDNNDNNNMEEEYRAGVVLVDEQDATASNEQQPTVGQQDTKNRVIQEELDVFLSSTDHLAHSREMYGNKLNSDETSYVSDNGTRYVKDPRTGNWVHEALAPAVAATAIKSTTSHAAQETSPTTNSNQVAASKKRKRAQFAARNARCWIYVSGLPADANEEEVAQVFSKAGIIALDPETQRPRVKLYRRKPNSSPPTAAEDSTSNGDQKQHARSCKGDASICFSRPESVELAITLLDGTPFRLLTSSFVANNNNNNKADPLLAANMRVERAKFQQHGTVFDDENRNRISVAKRKVAKLAAIQARDWDEGEFNGRLTGGRKGLRIIVVEGLFDPSSWMDDDDDQEEDRVLAELENDLRTECEQFGVVEKITVFAKNQNGVVVIKFALPGSASDAVKALDGQQWKDVGRLRAGFWDGVTDYTVHDEEKERQETEKRHEEFGEWLDKQDIPEELRLQTE